MQHFVQQDGLNMFRLPVTWQFLINSNNLNGTAVTNLSVGALPTSDGKLDPAHAAQYDQLVQACLATGSMCIVDMHNYARFEGQVVGQGGPTNEQFAGLWSQLATMYRNEAKVVFGVMNEPHDLPSLPMWADSVQAAVTAIRSAGATTQMILLPGTEFTHAVSYVSNGSAGNLSRVLNPDGSTAGLVFDVHQYLDSDGSGTHTECVTDRVDDTFVPLAKFLRDNGRKAMLTEIGGGNTTSVCSLSFCLIIPDLCLILTRCVYPQCIKDLCNTLASINQNSDVYLGYTAWAAGAFGTDYELAMTPFGTPGNFTDQETVRQCVVGTRGAAPAGAAAAGAAAAPNNATAAVTSTTTSFQAVGEIPTPTPIASAPASSSPEKNGQPTGQIQKAATAGSQRLAVGAAMSLVGLTAMIAVLS